MAEATAKLDFESAIKELENLVANMEKSNTGLDEMLKSFERGRELVRFCDAELARIKGRVEMVVNHAQPASAPADSLGVEEKSFE